MDTPAVRLGASIAMLAVLYWFTFASGSSTPRPVAAAGESLERLAESSHTHFLAERYSEALAPTEALAARYPTQHVYLMRLATIYQHLGRRREEAAAWRRFMEVSPTPWDACPAVATALAAAQDPAGALDAAERCWTLSPDDPDAAFFVGQAHERTGRVADAERTYRRALEIDSAHADSLLGLARLDLVADRLAPARAKAQAVFQRHPEHADAVLLLATVAQRQGDRTRARHYFRQTLTLAEHSFDATVGLAIVEFSDGNADASRQLFERALALNPSRRPEIAVWLERTGSSR